MALAAAIALAANPSGGNAAPRPTPTFAERAADAVETIRRHWYAGHGRFRLCADCVDATASDWGADSLIDVLYLRWLLTRDPALVGLFREIVEGEPGDTLGGFSDVPMWDAVAAIRAYDVTGDPRALTQARREYDALATSRHFALAPCPAIDTQLRDGGGSGIRTLETDANRILVGASLAGRVRDPIYARRALADAVRRYDAVRAAFLGPGTPLYSVYLFPRSGRCVREPRRQLFASVNGRMIEAGLVLTAVTHDERFARDAHDTATAIASLRDNRGVFVDLQAQNDVVAPLVVAMLQLARAGAPPAWLVWNARAMGSSRRADGAYGRFFDGPPPPRDASVSVFETNGGLALAVAAAPFAPLARGPDDDWQLAQHHPIAIRAAPARYAFHGSGIAFIGPLPAPGDPLCRPLTVGNCEGGRVAIRVDGRLPASEVGIWQGKSLVPSAATVLFAWRWATSGDHVIDFDPVTPNPKQGDTALDLREAVVLP
ncbi:MAG TPA: hypothetical protein VGN14_04070 [Candidatus Elarobacter sp.]